MTYNKHTWVAPEGSNLNLFTKAEETTTSVKLTHNPSFTNSPTQFSADWMNEMEAGIEAAAGGKVDFTLSAADAFKIPIASIDSSFASPGTGPTALTFDGTNLISADPDTNLIYIHSGITSTISSSFAAPSTDISGLTFDGTNLISCDAATGLIYIHSGITSTVSSSFSSPGTLPSGLTFDGTNLISCDILSDTIYIHSGITSTVSSSFASPNGSPAALGFDGINLISCDSTLNKIYIHSGITTTISSSFTGPDTAVTGVTVSDDNLISCDSTSDIIYIHDNQLQFSIAQVAATADLNAFGTFVLTDESGVTTVNSGIQMSTSAKTHQNTDISYVSISGNPDVQSVQLLKSDTVNASGAFLAVVYDDFVGTKDLSVELFSGTNWSILSAVDGSGLTPGDDVASILVAGEELLCKIDSAAGSVQVPNIGVNVESANTVRLLICWDSTPLKSASSIDFVGDASQSFIIQDGLGTASATIDASTGTFSAPEIKGSKVYTEFTLSSAFSGLTTLRGGQFIASSVGSKFILS